MKILTAAFAALLLSTLPASAADAPTPETTGKEGRYQMFQGKYQHWDSDKSALSQKEDLFMIDTTNGQSWVYLSSEAGGKETRYWFPSTYDEANPPVKDPASAPKAPTSSE